MLGYSAQNKDISQHYKFGGASMKGNHYKIRDILKCIPSFSSVEEIICVINVDTFDFIIMMG